MNTDGTVSRSSPTGACLGRIASMAASYMVSAKDVITCKLATLVVIEWPRWDHETKALGLAFTSHREYGDRYLDCPTCRVNLDIGYTRLSYDVSRPHQLPRHLDSGFNHPATTSLALTCRGPWTGSIGQLRCLSPLNWRPWTGSIGRLRRLSLLN